jgi:hypothetical protein
VDDTKLKEHVFCTLKKVGFINASGEFQEETIKTKLKKNVINPENVDTLVATCVVKKNSPQQFSFDFYECIHGE